jgi:hypothetical protein
LFRCPRREINRSIVLNVSGDLARVEGDLPAARRAFEAALAIATRLAAADPANTEWQRDLSISHIKLGELLFSEGNVHAAKGTYRLAAEIVKQLVARDSTNAQWRADLEWLERKLRQT